MPSPIFIHSSAWIHDSRSIINIAVQFSHSVFCPGNKKKCDPERATHVPTVAGITNGEENNLTRNIDIALQFIDSRMANGVTDMSRSHATRMHAQMVQSMHKIVAPNKRCNKIGIQKNSSEFQDRKNAEFTIILYFVWQPTAWVYARIIFVYEPNDLWLDQAVPATRIFESTRKFGHRRARDAVTSLTHTSQCEVGRHEMYKLNKINMDSLFIRN